MLHATDTPDASQRETTSTDMTAAPDNPPLVSIGIPVYNGASYLAATLDSVLAQNYENLDIVVADNASTDGTQDILREYLDQDSRIRCIFNEENVGAAGNYNLVLNEAKGDYFAWLSADDLIEAGYVEQAMDVLLERPEVIGVYSHAGRIDQRGNRLGDYHKAMSELQLDDPDPGVRFSSAVLGFPAIVLFGVNRRSAMLDTPGHGAYIGGDRVFVSELALKGRIVRLEEELFQRRVHPDAYSSMLDKQAKAKWFAGEDARAGAPDVERIKQHLAALKRSAPDMKTKLRGQFTMFARFPWVLGKTHAFNTLQRVLRLGGRELDRGRWAS